jgi:hypothetical protein
MIRKSQETEVAPIAGKVADNQLGDVLLASASLALANALELPKSRVVEERLLVVRLKLPFDVRHQSGRICGALRYLQ